MKNEPRRHHYIPQFIIKNFGINKMGICTVNYYDKKSKKNLNTLTEDIFVYNDLYRDEVNNSDDPVKIEKDFAKYESEIATIFRNKILNARDRIELTFEEHESLLLFISLMVYRSQNVVKKYGNISDEQINNLLKELNINSDLLTLWKKNLGKIVNCRSIDEVVHHPDIDDLFKGIAIRDTFGLLGRYIIFVDRRGPEDFVLSDACPLTHNIEDDKEQKFPLFLCLPISPSRMIISVINGIELADKSISMFDKSFFTKPFISNDGKKLSFSIRKMYEKDVAEFNDGMFNSSREGVAYSDEKRCLVIDRNK